MGEGEEAPCLCEFPGCGRQYLNEHSRRQHYRRAHGPEWANRAVRRRQKGRAKGSNGTDAVNASYNLGCRRPNAGRTNNSVSPSTQRPAGPQHYRAFSIEHVGASPAAEVSSEWMLRSYDEDIVAANCKYLAMLRNQAPKPTYLVDSKSQHTPSSSGTAQGPFDSVMQHEKRSGGWQLLGKDAAANHVQSSGLELAHQEQPIDHQNRDYLWSRRILNTAQPHAQSHEALCTVNQGYRSENRAYCEDGLTYTPNAMANANQPAWLKTKDAVASQCLYRSRPHSFTADNLFTTIQAKSAGTQGFARDHGYGPQYAGTRGLSPSVGQSCYPQELDRTSDNTGYVDAVVARQGVSYRAQDPAATVGDSVQCRDSLMSLQHGNSWASIAQRPNNVMTGQETYEVEAASYSNYTGEVISMARHGLAAPSETKANGLSRLRLHHSKALMSIFPPTPIET